MPRGLSYRDFSIKIPFRMMTLACIVKNLASTEVEATEYQRTYLFSLNNYYFQNVSREALQTFCYGM